jgi:hypothetical protein
VGQREIRRVMCFAAVDLESWEVVSYELFEVKEDRAYGLHLCRSSSRSPDQIDPVVRSELSSASLIEK